MIASSASHHIAPWLDVALREEAAQVVETGASERILTYLATCADLTQDELASDSTAWCAAFANWCMIEAGLAGTGTSWARDWFTWGVEDSEPGPGSVVVWKRAPGGNAHGPYGHVSFLIEARERDLVVLGGNQANRVTRLPYPREGLLRGDFYSEVAFRKPG